MRIGLLTGGGNMAGVNAAVRSVVTTTISRYGSEVVGILHGFEGLLQPPRVRSLGLKDVHGFMRRSVTVLGTAPRGNPFEQSENGSISDRSDELEVSFRWLGLDCLICIGGLGTVGLAHKISELGIPIIAIPKSTTNELLATDRTIGYSTAVQTAVSVIDRLQSVEENAHRLLYVQVMGREAGWTALTAAVAGGAHVVLIPEIPWQAEEINRLIQKRRERHRPSTIIVVASGAREAGSEPSKDLDSVARLAPAIQKLNGLDYDVTLLGPIQRGGEPDARDRFLATRFGARAVEAAHEGFDRHLVALKGQEISLVPLREAVDRHRLVEPRGPIVRTALDQGISVGVPAADLFGPAVSVVDSQHA